MIIRHPYIPLLNLNQKCIRLATQLSLRSHFSSGNESKREEEKLVKTSFHDNGQTATLTLNCPPINSLNLELNTAISEAIQNIEIQNPKTQALILNSSNPNVFSAGIDLAELYKPKSEDHLRKFWNSFQQVFIDIYSCKFTTIAAIEGHAPAGGCMIAMACDYRIMSQDPNGSKIGLSETKLGIVAPFWLADLMVNTIGFREAEKALGLGLLYSPEEAISIGLIDEIVHKREELEQKAHNEAMKWVKIPPLARHTSKMLLRQRLVQDLKKNREIDTDSFCEFVLNENVQKSLGLYIQSLKQKKN